MNKKRKRTFTNFSLFTKDFYVVTFLSGTGSIRVICRKNGISINRNKQLNMSEEVAAVGGAPSGGGDTSTADSAR